jgi:hypothetical protein
LDIIVRAVCAVICGADNWVEVELFGRTKQQWLRTFLELPHGIPSHDTFGRVFRLLDPEVFQRGFRSWIEAVQAIIQGQVVAIDGKTLRRSHDRTLGKAAIQMVSAWATANCLVPGQKKVSEHSKEITAIPELLEVLDLAGCFVTVDAIGCQREIAAAIIDQKADYVLVLKQNQVDLYTGAVGLFEYGDLILVAGGEMVRLQAALITPGEIGVMAEMLQGEMRWVRTRARSKREPLVVPWPASGPGVWRSWSV